MRGGRTFRIRRFLLLSAAAFATLWAWFRLCVWAFWPEYSWGPYGMGLHWWPQGLRVEDLLHPFSHPSWALCAMAACVLGALASLLADEMSLLPRAHASTKAFLVVLGAILAWMNLTVSDEGGIHCTCLLYGRPWYVYYTVTSDFRPGPPTEFGIEPVAAVADTIATGLFLAFVYALCEWAWTLPHTHAMHLGPSGVRVLSLVAGVHIALNVGSMLPRSAGPGWGPYDRGWPISCYTLEAATDLANLAIFLGALAAANVLWNRLRGCTWIVPVVERPRRRGATDHLQAGEGRDLGGDPASHLLVLHAEEAVGTAVWALEPEGVLGEGAALGAPLEFEPEGERRVLLPLGGRLPLLAEEGPGAGDRVLRLLEAHLHLEQGARQRKDPEEEAEEEDDDGSADPELGVKERCDATQEEHDGEDADHGRDPVRHDASVKPVLERVRIRRWDPAPSGDLGLLVDLVREAHSSPRVLHVGASYTAPFRMSSVAARAKTPPPGACFLSGSA